MDVDYNGDFVYHKAIGTDVLWKENKDLTKEFEVRSWKQRNKSEQSSLLFLLSSILIPGRHESHTSRTKDTPAKSFFNFFNPPQPPADNEEVDEEELEEISERLEIDYQIGEDFKERVRSSFIASFRSVNKILTDHPSRCGLLHRKSFRARS